MFAISYDKGTTWSYINFTVPIYDQLTWYFVQKVLVSGNPEILINCTDTLTTNWSFISNKFNLNNTEKPGLYRITTVPSFQFNTSIFKYSFRCPTGQVIANGTYYWLMSGNKLYYSTNVSTNLWTLCYVINNANGTPNFNSIAAYSTNGVALTTEDAGLYKFTSPSVAPTGTTLSPYLTTTTDMYTRGNTFILGDNNGIILVSTDAGVTWTSRDLPTTFNVKSICYDGTTLLVTDFSTFYKSTNLGVNWTATSIPNVSSVSNIVYYDRRFNVWSNTVNYRQIYESTDGITWTATSRFTQIQPSNAALYLLGTNGTQLYGVGPNGIVIINRDATMPAYGFSTGLTSITNKATCGNFNGSDFFVSTPNSGVVFTYTGCDMLNNAITFSSDYKFSNTANTQPVYQYIKCHGDETSSTLYCTYQQ